MKLEKRASIFFEIMDTVKDHFPDVTITANKIDSDGLGVLEMFIPEIEDIKYIQYSGRCKREGVNKMEEKNELTLAEKIVKSFGGVGRSAIELSNSLNRSTKMMKELEENNSPDIDHDTFIENVMKNINGPIEQDWKILDVNCLPEDILVGDYEFEYKDAVDVWIKEEKAILNIFDDILDFSVKYRYRPKPTKKTHEELAEEWNNDHFKRHSDNCGFDTHSVKEHTSESFIAGRKSMESEINP